MCELYGITGDIPVRANDMLKEFYTHSYKHPHGWGMRYFNKDGAVSMCKEAVGAHDSLLLPGLLNHDIRTSVLIAHIRFATIGSIAKSNSHPFTARDSSGREWTLAHNGNIYSGMELLPYLDTQAGETDSERVLLYLTDAMSKAFNDAGCPLDAVQRAALLDEKITAIAKRNKLNLLVYDGEVYYIQILLTLCTPLKNPVISVFPPTLFLKRVTAGKRYPWPASLPIREISLSTPDKATATCLSLQNFQKMIGEAL